MLSLKATLKAIGESITTIKSALDGKATKYTGYGTPVTLTTDWYTIPSDGFIQDHLEYTYQGSYQYIAVKNSDGTNEINFRICNPANSPGQMDINIPVFSGQKARIYYQSSTGNKTAKYYPYA